MTEVIMRRTWSGLEPASDDDRDLLRHISTGDLVKVDVVVPRNAQQHRLYWSLCALVAENHPDIRTRELASQAIKLLAGHVDLVKVGDRVLKVPKSISYSAMSQADFDVYFREAIRVVSEELLQSAPELIQNELLRRIT